MFLRLRCSVGKFFPVLSEGIWRVGAFVGAFFSVWVGALVCVSAQAQPTKSFEIFGYIGYLENSQSQYFGTVVHFAPKIYQPGWRLKFGGSVGNYFYFKGEEPIFAETTIGEIFLGYQFRNGNLTLKLYGGAHFERHELDMEDPDNPLAGDQWGAKISAESWLDLPLVFNRRQFVSANASISTIADRYAADMRYGFELLPGWMAGPEIAGFGSGEYRQFSAGGFVRGTIGGFEAQLSGGIARDFDGDESPYMSVSFSRNFTPF